MPWVLGIDLGTTFTAAGIVAGSRIETLSLGAHASAIPSAVYEGDDETVVGDAAMITGDAVPARLAVEFKRQFGETSPILVGQRFITAEELQATLGAWVYARACELEGGTPFQVVFTFPAFWGAFRRDTFLSIARRIAGDPEIVKIVTEPEAAAAYYGTRDRVPIGAIVGVYDFGGGTFDAAILRRIEDGFEMLGRPAGDDRLGGIDLDWALLQYVAEQAGLTLPQLERHEPRTATDLMQLRRNVITAKELLSVGLTATVAVAVGSVVTTVHLTRRELENLADPLIVRTAEVFEEALAFASVSVADLHSILLVGGASRMPRVAEVLNQRWSVPIALDSHPKFAVCLGAALWSQQAGEAAMAVPVRRDGVPPAPTTTLVSATAAEELPGSYGGPSPPTRGGRRRQLSTKLAIAAVVVIAIGAAVAWAALRSPNQSVAGGQTTTTISPTATNSTALTTAVEAIPPSTLPPTTVAAPSSVAVASSEAPDTTAATTAPTDPVAAAAALAQQLADAFAAHDWTTARQISPTPVWSDAVYEQGFGSLTASRLVVARSEAVGSSVKLWLGEIAHEEVSTGPQVSLYCARWDVDIAKGTIARISGRLLRHTAGDAEPADAEAVERTKCA